MIKIFVFQEKHFSLCEMETKHFKKKIETDTTLQYLFQHPFKRIYYDCSAKKTPPTFLRFKNFESHFSQNVYFILSRSISLFR